MYIQTTYKFEKDGVIGLACGYKPDAEILEEYQILYAEPDYELYKGEENVGTAVQLTDGDIKANYSESLIPEETEE